jgi:hypothetical protein
MKQNGIANRRIAESIGMLMIGEGALALARPQDHCRLWRGTNEWWSGVVGWFVEHPTVVRAFAALEIAAGFWLAFPKEASLDTAVAHPKV